MNINSDTLKYIFLTLLLIVGSIFGYWFFTPPTPITTKNISEYILFNQFPTPQNMTANKYNLNPQKYNNLIFQSITEQNKFAAKTIKNLDWDLELNNNVSINNLKISTVSNQILNLKFELRGINDKMGIVEFDQNYPIEEPDIPYDISEYFKIQSIYSIELPEYEEYEKNKDYYNEYFYNQFVKINSELVPFDWDLKFNSNIKISKNGAHFVTDTYLVLTMEGIDPKTGYVILSAFQNEKPEN